MKTIANIFIFSIVVLSQHVKAQDLLVKTDSSKYQVRIFEINPDQIRYKLFNYPDGPLITVSKTDIAYVTYKTGLTEKFKVVVNYNSYENENQATYERLRRGYLSPEEKDKRCEPLYKHQNYVGLNYIAFLNNCLGVNYIRDVKQANLLLMIPVAVGIGKPLITNELYRGQIDGPNNKFSYNNIKYQIGISPLFTPNMKRNVNFLIGPSFNYTAFDATTELNYSHYNATTGMSETKIFQNNFELRRKHYGFSVGFLSRMNERINMSMLLTFGYKEDTYNEKDPFGIDYINSLSNQKSGTYAYQKDNSGYANFLWSVGYRF